MHETRKSLGWRIFSVIMLILVVPFETLDLFRSSSTYDMVRHTIDSVAVVGVFGYAFNIRLGPKYIWRIFAAIFAAFCFWLLLQTFSRFWALDLPSPGEWVVVSVLALGPIAIIVFMMLALFRYGRSSISDRLVFA
ncbi:hypothetical protein ACQEPB_05165 [Novosphingobium fluoreni]|uniref:hypothetical protein n=1 Tax=Novosphingobium fluoreni TaxID=1391222 RepID=UPI003DA14E52